MAKKKFTQEEEPEYICPFCYRTFTVKELHKVCDDVQCTKRYLTSISGRDLSIYKSHMTDQETDPERTEYLRQDPKCVSARHISRNDTENCDMCGRKASTRLCPRCHNVYEPSDKKCYNIILIGNNNIGKSHYFVTLIDRLTSVLNKEFGLDLNVASERTAEKYEVMHNVLYGNDTLGRTPRFNEVGFDMEPLVYTVSSPDKKWECNISCFDIGFNDWKDSMVRSIMNDAVSKADGIVMLMDPLYLQNVKKNLTYANKPTKRINLMQPINSILHILDMGDKKAWTGSYKTLFSLVLTKCDILMGEPSSGDEAAVMFGRESLMRLERRADCIDDEYFDQIDSELREYIRRYGGGNIKDDTTVTGKDVLKTIDKFKNNRIFAVSALGTDPRNGRIEEHIYPIKVEDPIIWMLSKLTGDLQ